MSNPKLMYELLGKPKIGAVRTPHPSLLSKSKIGVEFEITGWNEEHESLYNYSETPDGSIRGWGAREFVFNSPLGGLAAGNALEEFHEHAVRFDYKGNASTAQHVHVNIRDMSPDQLLVMLSMYVLVERTIYTWSGNSRVFNNNCRPWFLSDTTIHGLVRWLTRQSYSLPYTKYCGLNLVPISSFGTVEYRHMQTEPQNLARSTEFVNIALSLKEIALQYETVAEFLAALPVEEVPEWVVSLLSPFAEYLPTFIPLLEQADAYEIQSDFKAQYPDLVEFTEYTPPEELEATLNESELEEDFRREPFSVPAIILTRLQHAAQGGLSSIYRSCLGLQLRGMGITNAELLYFCAKVRPAMHNVLPAQTIENLLNLPNSRRRSIMRYIDNNRSLMQTVFNM